MAHNIVCILLQRILWPIIIITCASLRPVGISFVYLLMFFILPFIPIANEKNVKGSVGAYSIVWIMLTTILMVIHIGLQVTIFVMGFDNIIGHCTFLEIFLRHIGFINLLDIEPLAILEWLVPELLSFSMSLVLHIALQKLAASSTEEQTVNNESQLEDGIQHTEISTKKNIVPDLNRKLHMIGPFISLILLFFAAVLRPSVPAAIYFLIFLGSGTYWAFYKSLMGRFRVILRSAVVILMLHTICIFIYQTPWPQEFLPSTSLTARLLGLEPLFLSKCNQEQDIRVISFNDSVNIDSYLSPIVILCSYYIISLTSNSLSTHKIVHRQKSTTEKAEDIALNTVDVETTEKPHTALSGIYVCLQDCVKFLYINSYVFTSIIMMVWSIVYHSWLTFVLLIAANILWMIPNQRKIMLRSSPFIVIYAEFLLIAQYLYSMNLNDMELPSSVEVSGINLRQIGFVKPLKYPCAPLFLKTVFTLMFWITMRQLFKEKYERKNPLILLDITAPPSIEESTSRAPTNAAKRRNTKFIHGLGEMLKNISVKLWIWLLILVIFLCGITGHRMTGFRICYMALFLFFVLAFQLSWRSWMRIMYGFWLVLIVYAMTILILIYTYQFDQFDAHWQNYFGISLTLQKDIGLEKYKTTDLFLHLVNPTIIVVMTVIQVHYFHTKFLESLMISKRRDPRQNDDETPVMEGESSEKYELEDDDSKDNEAENKPPQQASLFPHISRRHINIVVKTTHTAGVKVLDYFWMFAEIHLMKVILILTFWCCLVNICVLHIGFVFLTVLSAVSRIKIQVFISRVISVIMAILLLAKMIYQVDYINHKNYDSVCNENSTVSIIHINNAEWFGFSKITEIIGLATLLKGYIVYMIIVTLHAVVIFRQEHQRITFGMEIKRPPIIFDGVQRNDAETSIAGLFKFLSNYAYFKFGYEISLVMLVIVISYRQDILAILYVIWLCILCKLKRSSCQKIWLSLQFFVCILVTLQYLLFVGLPPGLCIEWPWYNSSYMNGLQYWAMVPGPHLRKQTLKLMLDFILLLCINQQHRVFMLEVKIDRLNILYPAGTNKSIVNEIDNLDMTPLDNPVPDFISNVRNWLDVLKIVFLNGWFWLSLAVVFLAGTNTISLFSIGYLIGSFIFLWQGTDFYLRPVRSILKWWTVLIAYNVIVITCKTFLQIGGCLFLSTLENHACWFVHLLGISCFQDHLTETLSGLTTPVKACPEILGGSGLTWDAICFMFLIFQLRIFKSYYFHHIINDAKASTTLASRGAEIIEKLRVKEIEHKKRREKETILKIKSKMEKIRSKQESLQRYSANTTHYAAIRAGDYFMFDELDDKIEFDVVGDDDNRRTKQHSDINISPIKFEETEEESLHAHDEEIPTSKKDLPVSEDSLLKKIFDSAIRSLLERLTRASRNYRHVTQILENEKKRLKDSKGFGLGTRTGTGNIWTPFKYDQTKIAYDKPTRVLPSSQPQPGSTEIIETVEQPEVLTDPRTIITSLRDDEPKPFDPTFGGRKYRVFVELLIALWYTILANTDLLCYAAALINQVATASLLSLTIPLMIFLWGTLSIPRPTKTFWITLIAYTQTVVLIKCVFQFKMIWFNQSTEILTVAKIIGVQFASGNAGYDLILLLMLFFHRFLLKSQGLWKSEYRTDCVDDGAYIVMDDLPPSDDINGGVASDDRREVAVVRKKENTLLLTRQNPEDTVEEGEACVQVSNFIEEPGNYLPEIVKFTSAKYCSAIVDFLQDLLHKARLPTDVYAYMFLCDFINFFVLVFGFSAFDNQRADGGFTTYLEENRVPVSFLVMLVLQFVLIIIDRAIYLRKAVKIRLGYHLFLVLGIHIWMFFVIPSLQGKVFNSQTPTVIFYLVKCVYFILSSYQLRCGYPSRIAGNFFTKSFSIMNMVSFKIYMAIPLLFEFRTMLDWVCTDTTMTLFEWLKMEDIFAEIFSMKCARQMESDLPVPRGVKKPLLVKTLMGGGFIFILSFLIWGPFVIFALSSAVGISNVPYDVSISLRVGPYEPVYEMSAQDSSIHVFDTAMMQTFKSTYAKHKEATTLLSDYDPEDIATMVLGVNSASLWSISPPDKARLLEDLKQNRTLTCRLKYTISRKSFSKEHPATATGETMFELSGYHPGRVGLVEMLEGRNTSIDVKLAGLLPKFLKVKSNGDLRTVTPLLPVKTEYRDMVLRFYADDTTNQSWWQLNEFCADGYYTNVLSHLPLANCDSKIVLYTFSDKLFPSYLSLFTAGGIIGMYTTIVLVGSRFLRAFITGASRNIMFEELPYVDRVLQLCLDVYLVREASEFSLEEDLFAKLLFLYRSPETMVKWTRPKNNIENNAERISGRSNVGQPDESILHD